jgi:uncharacterized membrane protein YebE (DUF533 family)
MFDANKILGTLMESGMARSGQSRFQRVAAGSGGSGSSGGLAGMLGSLLGGGQQEFGQQGFGQQRTGGSSSLGGLGSLLGGGGRTGGASSAGAMGLLGMLASAAMQHFGSGGQGARQGSAQPGLAEDAAPYGDDVATDEQGRATVMIRAMISAAKADGEIDPQERQKILGRLQEAGADPEAQAFVRDEMARPADLQAIVSAVDSPHTAIEVYAASLFAIDVDTEAEAAYMRQLAQGLKLNPTLVRELHESLEAPQLH